MSNNNKVFPITFICTDVLLWYLHIKLKKHFLLLPAASGASHHFKCLYDTNAFLWVLSGPQCRFERGYFSYNLHKIV